MDNKVAFIKPSDEINSQNGTALVPDENNIIHIDEIPDPGFDMKYYEFDEKQVKRVEVGIRSSFEYRGIIQFIKHNLNVNHCSFYEGYSMKNGLTIELHHSPFTLYDITEAVMAKSLKLKGYWESFRVIEEVNRLHYEFKIGLTPLNPTAHKLVHNQTLTVHPKIVIGYWKEFYGEYQAYLSEAAVSKYKEMLDMETRNVEDVKVPKILEYRPTIIQSPIHAITQELVDKLYIDSKLNKLEDYSNAKEDKKEESKPTDEQQSSTQESTEQQTVATEELKVEQSESSLS